MQVVRDLASFVADPVGRAFVGEHHVVWSFSPSVAGTFVYGYCDRAEAIAITRAWNYEARLARPYRAVVDVAELSGFDPDAFRVVERDMARRIPDLETRLARQAVVRPPGMVGAFVAGFYHVLSPGFGWRAFARRADAYAWAFGAEGPAVCASVMAIVDAHRPLPLELSALRATMARDLDHDPGLPGLARRVGASPRSVQRAFARAGTTYRREVLRLRVARARELLVTTDLKVEAVARSVGVRSLSSFVALFRRAVGVTPAGYRREHTEGGDGP